MDNIYVNSNTIQLVVEHHLASINNTNGNCASRGVGLYLISNNNNKTKYILLQCKYDTNWIIYIQTNLIK